MNGIVHAPIGDVGSALAVVDASRRLYVGLSHDGSYWHVVSPYVPDHPDGETYELTCTCAGGRYHGRCWRLDQAVAFEAGNASAAALPFSRPDWLGPDPRAELLAGRASFDAPAGAGELVEASRG